MTPNNAARGLQALLDAATTPPPPAPVLMTGRVTEDGVLLDGIRQTLLPWPIESTATYDMGDRVHLTIMRGRPTITGRIGGYATTEAAWATEQANDNASEEAAAAQSAALKAQDEAEKIRADFDVFTPGVNADLVEYRRRIGAVESEVEEARERAEHAVGVGNAASQEAANALLTALQARDESMVGTNWWYASSADPTLIPTFGWAMVPPTWAAGAYIWRKSVTFFGDGTSVEGDPELITGNEGPKGDSGTDAVLARIMTSKGTVFKPGMLDTDLSVVIWWGGYQITDLAGLRWAFGTTAYVEWSWVNTTGGSGLISAADSRLTHDGFRFHVTHEDVDRAMTFEVTIKT